MLHAPINTTVRIAALSVVLAAAGPAAAGAAKVIQAQTVWQFDATSYAIDQGEAVTFANRDALSPGPHDVSSNDAGQGGKPLFRSMTIPNGQDSPVEGAQQLKTGSYGFFCSVHPFMTATLVVSDKGAPLPAPGATPPPAPAPDTRAPVLTATLQATSLRRALRTRSLVASLRSDEAASLRLRLTARSGRRTTTVATASGRLVAGRKATVHLRINRAAVRRLSGRRRVAFTLTATAKDGAGNTGRATARRTLSR